MTRRPDTRLSAAVGAGRFANGWRGSKHRWDGGNNLVAVTRLRRSRDATHNSRVPSCTAGSAHQNTQREIAVINGTAVSVVIPTIGRASLRTAVDSALNQTSPPMEVIVVLDRDCDPDLPESDSIRVLRTPGRVGPSRAKQIGVESAKGNVIALLDDDDVWYPDKLEKQLAAAPVGDEWIVSVDISTMLPGASR